MNKQLPLAENHITITEHVFREANNATANRSWIKTMKYLSLLAALACAGLFVWLRSTGSSPIILLGEILFLGALLLWLLIFFPRSQSRTRYKSLCKGLSDPPKRIIRFYASHLEATGDQIDRTVIDYDQITGYLTTKICILSNCLMEGYCYYPKMVLCTVILKQYCLYSFLRKPFNQRLPNKSIVLCMPPITSCKKTFNQMELLKALNKSVLRTLRNQ